MMKTLNPKIFYYLLLALLFVHLFYLWTFSQSQKKALTTEQKYSMGSVLLIEYWDKFWSFYSTNQFDSAVIVSQNTIELGKELMAVRYDSSLYGKYGKAYGNLGYGMLALGKYEESINYSLRSYDTLKSKFGENHIRITEALVGISWYYQLRGDYEHALEYILLS